MVKCKVCKNAKGECQQRCSEADNSEELKVPPECVRKDCFPCCEKVEAVNEGCNAKSVEKRSRRAGRLSLWLSCSKIHHSNKLGTVLQGIECLSWRRVPLVAREQRIKTACRVVVVTWSLIPTLFLQGGFLPGE